MSNNKQPFEAQEKGGANSEGNAKKALVDAVASLRIDVAKSPGVTTFIISPPRSAK